jgi:hypothetical protein
MVNTTILIALTSIATKQGKPMQEMMKKVKQLLNCATQQEDATITYNASKMIMLAHIYTGHCNKKKAQIICAGGYFFLSSNKQFPPNNGAILTML